MAKNTSSSAFRRVDVDQYTEGKYEEDALTDDGVNGPNDMEIQTMLSQYPLLGFFHGSTTTGKTSFGTAVCIKLLLTVSKSSGDRTISVHVHFGTWGWSISVHVNFGTVMVHFGTCRFRQYYFGTSRSTTSIH